MRPGNEGAAEPFKGLTGKVATSVELPDQRGMWSVDSVMDFNALGLIAASRIAVPVTTVTAEPTAYEHVFTLNPDAADTMRTYTTQWGDSTAAIQGVFGVFQSLGMEVVRGNLNLSSSFMSRALDYDATLVTAGVTTMASAPIPSRSFDVWADDAWADLGTTKLLACYRMNWDMGDKFAPDAPINSAIVSFESLLEAEDQDYTVTGTYGLDATARGLIDSFEAGAIKVFRLAVDGPLIGGGVSYRFQLDWAQFLTDVNEVGTAPNSPAVALELPGALAREDVTGNALELTLINTVASY
jgi:hypothetical protein